MIWRYVLEFSIVAKQCSRSTVPTKVGLKINVAVKTLSFYAANNWDGVKVGDEIFLHLIKAKNFFTERMQHS